MSIRCFIAVELDDLIRRDLDDLQKRIQKELGPDDKGIKWVRPEQMHLTLKFLGDTEDALLPDVCAAISEVADQFEPFSIEVEGCGCFPPQGSARVFWAGVKQGQEDLAAVAEFLDEQMNQLGYPLENRKFSAHLTLARIKQPKSGHRVREVVQTITDFCPGTQAIDQLVLFQSFLEREGPTYVPMHHAALGEG